MNQFIYYLAAAYLLMWHPDITYSQDSVPEKGNVTVKPIINEALETTRTTFSIVHGNFTTTDNDVTASPSSQKLKTPVYVLDTLSKIYIVIGTVGIIANGMTVAIMASSPKTRNSFTNWFIINQSVLDLWSAVFMIVSIPANRKIFVNLSGVGGDLLCKFWLGKVFMWSLFVSSTYNLVVLTFERYCKVVHPIFHRNNFSGQQAIVVAICIWGFGFAYNFAYKIPPSGLIGGRCVLFQYPNKQVSLFVGLLTLIVQYFFPLVALIYCYGRMAQKLRGKVGVLQPDNQNEQRGAAAINKGTEKFLKNTIKTLAIVAGSFVLCWSWNQWMYLFFNLGYKIDFSGGFNGFTVIAMFLNCCLNPVIYALKYR